MSEPEVSVIVPTRNRSQRLAVALRSALQQRGVDLEVVVVDDGSTDDTPAIISDWSAQIDDDDLCVRFIRQPNQGADVARNTAVDASSGEFIQFMDSDDILHPAKLTECMARFDSEEIDTVVCRHVAFRDIEEIRDALEAPPVHHPTRLDPERRPFYARMGWELWEPVYRRTLIAATGPMRVGIRAGGTYEYTTRLKLTSRRRAYAPLVLVYYRRGATGALTSLDASMRVPATAQVMQYVFESLSARNIRDRREWKHLLRKSVKAYRSAVATNVSEGRALLLSIVRRAAWRWNPIAGAVFSSPEPLIRTIVKVSRAVKVAMGTR